MIKFENVNKWYGAYQALVEVTEAVDKGEVVVVCGPSGSGKSTLIRTLNRLEPIQGGSIHIDGQDIHAHGLDVNAFRSRIGFVFQQFNLLPRTSALENVELPMVYSGVKAAVRRERAQQALQRVGLGERVNHTPAELSGGQQQRVAIARALVNAPQLILADEPTGALDSQTSEDIMRLLTELNQQGMTVVLVTHEADIASWARRKLVFRDGSMVEDTAQSAKHMQSLSVAGGCEPPSGGARA